MSTHTVASDALLAVAIPPAARHPKVRMITRSQIHPDPEQPRAFPDAELRDSIARNGLLQPITVRPHPSILTEYMIVDGERRWRGCEGVLEDLACIVRTDMIETSRRLATQLEANTGKPLTPLEEAKAFARLIDDTGMSVADLAEFLGRAPSTVAERVGLLELGPWLPLIERGDIVLSHAVKVLLPLRGIPDAFQEKAVKEVESLLGLTEASDRRLSDFRNMVYRAVKPFLYPLTKSKAHGAKSAEFNTSKHDVECGCGVIRVALGYEDNERTYCGDPTWWRPRHNAAVRAKKPKGTEAKGAPTAKLYLPAGTPTVVGNYGQPPKGVVQLTNTSGEWSVDSSDPFDPRELVIDETKLVQWAHYGRFNCVGTKDAKAVEAARDKWAVRFDGEARQARVQLEALIDQQKQGYRVEGTGAAVLAGLYVGRLYDEDLDRVCDVADALGIALSPGARKWSAEHATKWASSLSAVDAGRLLTGLAVLQAHAKTVKSTSDVVQDLENGALAAIRKSLVPWRTKPKEEKKPTAKTTSAKASQRTPTADFMKDVHPSPALAAVIGNKPMPRTDVTKKLWKYIKTHGLQDTKNRRMINADEKLRPVFGGKNEVSMFEMTKMINKHLAGTAEAAALIYTGKKEKKGKGEIPLAKLSKETAELPLNGERLPAASYDDDEENEDAGWVTSKDDTDDDLWDSTDDADDEEDAPLVVKRG